MSRQLRLMLLLAGTALLAVSCQIEKLTDGEPREDSIKVYQADGDKAISNLQVPMSGTDSSVLRIVTTDANVAAPYYVEDPSLTEQNRSWFNLKKVNPYESGEIILSYKASSLIETQNLSRRSGSITISNPQTYLGRYLPVYQGFENIYYNSFNGETQYDCIVLDKGESYTTDICAKLANTYYDYVSFNVYALTDDVDLSQVYTLDMSSKDLYFEAVSSKSMAVQAPFYNVAPTPDEITGLYPQNTFTYFMISNKTVQISGEAVLTFTNKNNPSGVKICIDNLRYYKLSEADIEENVDEEFDFDDDNW